MLKWIFNNSNKLTLFCLSISALLLCLNVLNIYNTGILYIFVTIVATCCFEYISIMKLTVAYNTLNFLINVLYDEKHQEIQPIDEEK